jgi:uncharacterized glyoxalase superfamily protein PhnB
MVTQKKSSPPVALELKPIIPARDFDLSKRFYRAIGFNEDWTNGEVAFFKSGDTSFLLRVEDDPGPPSKLQMQIIVDSADAWYEHVKAALEQFGMGVPAPVTQPWGARDFVITDPTGVRWRITQPHT